MRVPKLHGAILQWFPNCCQQFRSGSQIAVSIFAVVPKLLSALSEPCEKSRTERRIEPMARNVLYIYIYIYVYVCMNMYTYVCVESVCTYVYIYVLSLYVCMYVYLLDNA